MVLAQLTALSRFHIALVGASGSMTFGYILTNEIQWALMGYVLLDWFMVNLYNKVVDWKEDAKNSINHANFAHKHGSKIYAFLNVLITCSFASHYFFSPGLVIPRMCYHFLGFIYNFKIIPFIPRLKEMYFFKNFASACGFMLTLFIYPLFAAQLSPEVQGSVNALKAYVFDDPSLAVVPADAPFVHHRFFIPALMLFFAVFETSFEVIYDIRDYVGDKEEGVRTYAVVHGKAWACRLVLILDIAAMLIMLVSLITEVVLWKQGVMIAAPLFHAIGFYWYSGRQVAQSNAQKLKGKGNGGAASITVRKGEVTIGEGSVQCLTWGFVLMQVVYVLTNVLGMRTDAEYVFGRITPIKVVVWAMVIIFFFTYQWNKHFFNSPAQFFLAYFLVGLGGCICENTAIWIYDYYHYDQNIWNVYVGVMPLEVTLIWPQVLFASYRFGRDNLKLSGLKLALASGFEVTNLAIFVEICCVSRKFWTWTESNIAGVPLIGCIGWGIYAVFAALAIDSIARGKVWKALLLPITSFVAVHVGLVVLWNVFGFKHFSNYDIPLENAAPLVAVAALAQTFLQFASGLNAYAKLTFIQEAPRLLAAVALGYTLYMGSPPRALVIVPSFIAIPYFTMQTIGWPQYLAQQRELDLEAFAADKKKTLKPKQH